MKRVKVSKYEQTCSVIYSAVPWNVVHLEGGRGDDDDYGTAGGDGDGDNGGCLQQIGPYCRVVYRRRLYVINKNYCYYSR